MWQTGFERLGDTFKSKSYSFRRTYSEFSHQQVDFLRKLQEVEMFDIITIIMLA